MNEFDKSILKDIQEAGLEAQKKALEIMKFIIVAEDGWIVRKNKDGSTVKLHKLTT